MGLGMSDTFAEIFTLGGAVTKTYDDIDYTYAQENGTDIYEGWGDTGVGASSIKRDRWKAQGTEAKESEYYDEFMKLEQSQKQAIAGGGGLTDEAYARWLKFSESKVTDAAEVKSDFRADIVEQRSKGRGRMSLLDSTK